MRNRAESQELKMDDFNKKEKEFARLEAIFIAGITFVLCIAMAAGNR